MCGPSRASFMTGMYSNQTKITKNNMNLRNSIPDVITMGQRFRQQGYQSVRIGKMFHYDNPSAIGTSGNDDIYSWDQTVNPYGRDKLEEYKINTLSPRKYGGTLSWLAEDEGAQGYGFNPPRLHAFQACALSHSATSPKSKQILKFCILCFLI